MIIDEFVTLSWNNRTRKHFENRGYIFTNYGDPFSAKITDLPDGSNIKIRAKCDNCSAEHYIVYHCIKTYTQQDGKTYCKKCKPKMLSSRTQINNFLSNGGESFGDWCIKNDRKVFLNNWDYSLNRYSPFEISSGCYKMVYLKCPINDDHPSHLRNVKNIKLSGSNEIHCPICNSFKLWYESRYGVGSINNIWDYQLNTLDPHEVSFGSKQKAWFKCQNTDYHPSYEMKISDFSLHNSRCPYCCNHRVHPRDSIGAIYPESINLWSDSNDKSPFEYSPGGGSEVYWKCQCGKHADYKRYLYRAIALDFRCPQCSAERDQSMWQETVSNYIKQTYPYYTLLHEYDCTLVLRSPNNGDYCLRFDNEIKELKLLIEVHGEQHYGDTLYAKFHARKYNITPEQSLKALQQRDKFKKRNAIDAGYKYLELPYWDIKSGRFKEMIDNTVNSILITKEAVS